MNDMVSAMEMDAWETSSHVGKIYPHESRRISVSSSSSPQPPPPSRHEQKVSLWTSYPKTGKRKSAVNPCLQNRQPKAQNETQNFFLILKHSAVFTNVVHLKWYFLTDHPSELILTKIEPLQNKWVITKFSNQKGATVDLISLAFGFCTFQE